MTAIGICFHNYRHDIMNLRAIPNGRAKGDKRSRSDLFDPAVETDVKRTFGCTLYDCRLRPRGRAILMRPIELVGDNYVR